MKAPNRRNDGALEESQSSCEVNQSVVCVCTHFVSTEGGDVVIAGRVSKLDSVLAGFGLTTQGTFSVRDQRRKTV